MSKQELLEALENVRREVARTFGSLPADRLFTAPGEGGWSPAQHLRHLVLSADPLARALRIPGFVLAFRFGRSKTSRTSSEVIAGYREKLSAGAGAMGRYVPREEARAEGDEAARARLLADWDRTAQSLLRATRRLGERTLDRHRLPHPLIGKLTLREMLTWTVYHNHHHLATLRRLLGEPPTPPGS